jgi:hypothetical protein
MPFLTAEDYEMLPEGVREKIRVAEADYDSGKKTREELTQAITKIYSNPKTKKLFEEINKEAKLGLNIPSSPIDAYVEPLEKEIKDMKTEKKKEEEEKEKKAVKERMAELNIPESKIPEIAKFQAEHGISNNISAIELWAERREPEPQSAEYTKPFSFKEAPNEEDAYNKSLAEVRQFKKSQLGRR